MTHSSFLAELVLAELNILSNSSGSGKQWRERRGQLRAGQDLLLEKYTLGLSFVGKCVDLLWPFSGDLSKTHLLARVLPAIGWLMTPLGQPFILLTHSPAVTVNSTAPASYSGPSTARKSAWARSSARLKVVYSVTSTWSFKNHIHPFGQE